MKKVFAILTFLAICAPCMALSFTTADGGNGNLIINYTLASGEGLRGLALTIDVVAGDACVASAMDYTAPAFNTFIDYAYSNGSSYTMIGEGHPFAQQNAPGAVTFPANSFSLSMGHLDMAGQQSAITTSGSITVHFTATSCSTIVIDLDPLRGGAIGDNLDLSATGLPSSHFMGPCCAVQLTLSTTYGGTVINPGIGTFYFNYGQAVPIGTSPNPNHFFWKWTVEPPGAIPDVRNPAPTILMNSDISMTANWTLSCQQYNLTKLVEGAPDNAVNVNDLNSMITWVTVNKTTYTFAVGPNNPRWLPNGPKYNITKKEGATDNVVNVSDLNALISFVNKRKTGSVFAVNCATCGC